MALACEAAASRAQHAKMKILRYLHLLPRRLKSEEAKTADVDATVHINIEALCLYIGLKGFEDVAVLPKFRGMKDDLEGQFGCITMQRFDFFARRWGGKTLDGGEFLRRSSIRRPRLNIREPLTVRMTRTGNEEFGGHRFLWFPTAASLFRHYLP